MPRGDCDSWSGPVPLWGLCYSALTRRRAGSFRRIVNCAPAKCCVWPVIAPAEASVRAGVGLRGVRFCWDVLRSVHACHAVLLECLAFGSRLPCGSVGMSGVRFTPVSFPLSGKERRLAVCSVPIPPGRDRHSCVLAASFGYRALWVHFGFARFFVAIPTGLPGTRGTRKRGRRHGVGALYIITLAL